jgi:hypothetical protein
MDPPEKEKSGDHEKNRQMSHRHRRMRRMVPHARQTRAGRW